MTGLHCDELRRLADDLLAEVATLERAMATMTAADLAALDVWRRLAAVRAELASIARLVELEGNRCGR